MHTKLLFTVVATATVAAAAAIPRMETPGVQRPLVPRSERFTPQQLESKKYWDTRYASYLKFLTEYHNGKRDLAEAQNVPYGDIDPDIAEFMRYFEKSDADDEGQTMSDSSEAVVEKEDAAHQLQRRGFLDWLKKLFQSPVYKQVL